MGFFRDKIYTYTLEADYVQPGPIPRIEHVQQYGDKRGLVRLTISPAGHIIVHRGYSWDGCSPKVTFFNAAVFGTWDGPLLKDGYPTCYYPSLVHDALCQFARSYRFPYTYAEIDRVFLRMMLDAGWVNAHAYYDAVRLWHRLSLRG